MQNKFLVRLRVVLATGFLSLTVSVGVPAIAQEAESSAGESPVFLESTISPDADPSAATTIENIQIPIEELRLRLRPLTLGDLENEAAAWFSILKNKVEEISNAEIAIRRANRVIALQQEASTALSEAEVELTEAEAELEATSEGTTEYQEAAQRVEAARESFREAQRSLEEVLERKQELQGDEALQETLQDAGEEGRRGQARDVLQQARDARDELTAGSEAYETATENINALDQALVDAEAAAEDLDSAVPESQEAEEARQALEEVETSVQEIVDTILASGLVEIEDNTAEIVEPDQGAEDGDVQDEAQVDSESLGEAAEQLDISAEQDEALKTQLLENVTALQGDRTVIIDRLNVVLEELERKGGDPTSYQRYIDAVTIIEIDVSDTEGLGIRIWSWLKSEEGGLRWGIGIAKFSGIVLVSLLLSRVIASLTRRTLRQISAVSNLFREFLVIVVERGIVVVGVLVALTSLGVSLGPLLAVFGGVSFVLAFALQSNLGNFASGLMLLFYKPFDVGDFVIIPGLGQKGYVRDITLANTTFNHYDGKIITVPNSTVWSSTIQNLLPNEERLVEFMFVINSNDDALEMQESWTRVVEAHPDTVKEKWYMGCPFVSPADGTIWFWCGAFALKTGFWDVYTDLYNDYMAELRKAGITVGVIKHENYAYIRNSSELSDRITAAQSGHHHEVMHGGSDHAESIVDPGME
jgi:small conductance mechanosensitive channel